MYDVVTVTCGSFEHAVALSTIDKRLLALLEPKIPSESVQVIRNVFLRSHRTRAKSIARPDLIRSIEKVLGAIDEDGDGLAFVYSFSYKDGQFEVSGPGGTSGIRMPGDSSSFYFLKAGVGICSLERMGIDQSGRGYVIDVTDCRDRKSLMTENKGRSGSRGARSN
jgi:hypothetical protein